MSRADRNIEDLFRRHLSSESSGGIWDVPSDDVWHGVEAVLLGKRRKRRVLWIFFIGAAVLALVTYGVIDYLHAGQPKSHETEETRALPPATTSTAQPDRIPGPMGRTDSREAVAEAIVSSTPEEMEVKSKDVLQHVTQTPEMQPAELVTQTGTHAASIQKLSGKGLDTGMTSPSNAVADTTRIVGEMDIQERMSAVAEIGGRPRSLVWESYVVPAVQPPVQQQTSHGKWILGGYLAPALGMRWIDVPARRPALRKALLQQEEESLVRLDFGLSAALQISPRWTFGAGAEYADFKLRSQYTRQIRFTRAGEVVNDRGNLENNYRVNIQTSYGRISTDVIVERDQATTISENTFITFEMPVHQSLKVLRMPVYAQYRLTNGRIPVSARGGISLNYLVKDHLNVQGIVTVDQTVDRIRALHQGSLQGAKSVTLGYQLGIGADIPLQKSWSLGLEVITSASAEPVYRDEELRIFPVSTEVRLGVRYKLKE